MPFAQAQVCSGGVDTCEVHAETMESDWCRDFILQENFWISTAPAEAITFSGHGQRSSGRCTYCQGAENIMIRITQLKLPISHTEAQLTAKIAKVLRLKHTSFSWEIQRRSLDARHKDDKNSSIP